MDTTEAHLADVTTRLRVPLACRQQLPLLEAPPTTLHAAIASLALGGAERIVLDWAANAVRHYRVRLIVLRAATPEWPLPDGIEIVRVPAGNSTGALQREGARIAASENSVVLCHLLTAAERRALGHAGAVTIPVVHNARDGWIEPASALADAPWLIAVSRAAAAQLSDAGHRKISVMRHLPPTRRAHPDARNYWRNRWCIPQGAFVIGMIGGVKPQKAYPRALSVLAAMLSRRDAWLVVLGGPAGRDGQLAWRAVIEQALRLGLSDRVRLPGFLTSAERALPAFDVVLNTSRYEGLSIATLEALAAGLPVVATRVGGQGEISAPGLHLLAFDSPPRTWADAIDEAMRCPVQKPRWAGFPSARLWTLMHLPPPRTPGASVMLVTANLNAGGAQRSLVNLAIALAGKLSFEIAVCGISSSNAFADELRTAGIDVGMTTASRDCFDHAEALLRRAASRDVRTIVFWNVDPKVKLLLAKRSAHSALRLIDVSPGAYAFEEMDATEEFQTWIAYSAQEYYARLDRLVLKYQCAVPVEAKCAVIRNGVPHAASRLRQSNAPLRRIVVSGRIAPTKYLQEILVAMQTVWRSVPDAELHILGTAETRDRLYAQSFLRAAGAELNHRVFVHGAAFDAPQRLADFDLTLVIGHHQGSPNAVLEAMAAGLPVVANDSGGTREAVIDDRTGVLLPNREPDTIAAGLLRVMNDSRTARRLARAGRAHVARRFSMRTMKKAYQRLFAMY